MIRNPDLSITNGYDVHVVFSKNQREKATLLSRNCIEFLQSKNIVYKHHKIFDAPVGPWPTPMWQFILPKSEHAYRDLGCCISWFMLNRGEFSVMIHPNSKEEGEMGGAYEDHSQNMFWMGPPLSLKMSIFEKEALS